jgi:predicted DNA-binding transcriptional regulator AlpA
MTSLTLILADGRAYSVPVRALDDAVQAYGADGVTAIRARVHEARSDAQGIDSVSVLLAMLAGADELLDTAAVASRLGIGVESVHVYRARGDLPEPDLMLGRSPRWRASTIDAWKRSRPGRGTGGGRPRTRDR